MIEAEDLTFSYTYHTGIRKSASFYTYQYLEKIKALYEFNIDNSMKNVK